MAKSEAPCTNLRKLALEELDELWTRPGLLPCTPVEGMKRERSKSNQLKRPQGRSLDTGSGIFQANYCGKSVHTLITLGCCDYVKRNLEACPLITQLCVPSQGFRAKAAGACPDKSSLFCNLLKGRFWGQAARFHTDAPKNSCSIQKKTENMYAPPASNIMSYELAFIVAVQYCILHHQLKYVEGTSPDSIAVHKPAWLIWIYWDFLSCQGGDWCCGCTFESSTGFICYSYRPAFCSIMLSS